MAPIGSEQNQTQDSKDGASITETPYRYSHLLPDFSDKTLQEHFPPLTPFTHVDPAARALAQGGDPLKYLSSATSVKDLTPHLGVEVNGVDLTVLDNHGRDQLALHTARRGLLVFRDQENFLSQSVEDLRNWGRYFGR